MKQAIHLVTVLSAAVLLAYSQQPDRIGKPIAADGEYVGLQPMPSLTPEDRDTAWFHENRLLIRSDEAILDMVPITIRHAQRGYSASDGGFFTYRAKFSREQARPVVALRLVQADYALIVVRNPDGSKYDAYSEIKTYAVTFSAGVIKINGVRYKRTKFDESTRERLLHVLDSEPMEKRSTTPK